MNIHGESSVECPLFPPIFQVSIPGGVFWFGTQMDHLGKIMPASAKDGADPRKKVIMK